MSISGTRDAGPDVGTERTSVRWRIFLLMLALVSVTALRWAVDLELGDGG